MRGIVNSIERKYQNNDFIAQRTEDQRCDLQGRLRRAPRALTLFDPSQTASSSPDYRNWPTSPAACPSPVATCSLTGPCRD